MWDIDALFERTQPSCAALMFGSFEGLLSLGSAASVDGQGTMTFVRHRDRFFGITNDHVLSEVPDHQGDRVWHIALRAHTPLPIAPIVRTTTRNPDLPFDLSVYELTSALVDEVGRSGKRFLAVPDALVLQENDDAIAVGFPGERRRIDGSIAVHGNYLAAAPCVQSSDRLIVLHHPVFDEPRQLIFGGMSGGPIFRLTAEGVEFSGIIFQGRGPNEDADDNRDFWVWGFPLTVAVMDRALELSQTRRS